MENTLKKYLNIFFACLAFLLVIATIFDFFPDANMIVIIIVLVSIQMIIGNIIIPLIGSMLK